MTFRLVVRDNQLPVGGYDYTDSTVEVNLVASATGFVVSTPNVASVNWYAGSTEQVTWNKSNSNLAPVNCAYVRILYSTNGGTTFTLLKDSVVNDGLDSVAVPLGITTTQARIKIEAIGNIFFDISNANFKIFPYALKVKNFVATNSAIAISPNPSTTGIFYINSELNNMINYEVYDVLGNLKQSNSLLTTQGQINLQSLTKGLYFVKLKAGTSVLRMLKLVYN
jgi:hypothetical protein